VRRRFFIRAGRLLSENDIQSPGSAGADWAVEVVEELRGPGQCHIDAAAHRCLAVYDGNSYAALERCERSSRSAAAPLGPRQRLWEDCRQTNGDCYRQPRTHYLRSGGNDRPGVMQAICDPALTRTALPPCREKKHQHLHDELTMAGARSPTWSGRVVGVAGGGGPAPPMSRTGLVTAAGNGRCARVFPERRGSRRAWEQTRALHRNLLPMARNALDRQLRRAGRVRRLQSGLGIIVAFGSAARLVGQGPPPFVA